MARYADMLRGVPQAQSQSNSIADAVALGMQQQQLLRSAYPDMARQVYGFQPTPVAFTPYQPSWTPVEARPGVEMYQYVPAQPTAQQDPVSDILSTSRWKTLMALRGGDNS
jgi:hypothetical protein